GRHTPTLHRRVPHRRRLAALDDHRRGRNRRLDLVALHVRATGPPPLRHGRPRDRHRPHHPIRLPSAHRRRRHERLRISRTGIARNLLMKFNRKLALGSAVLAVTGLALTGCGASGGANDGPKDSVTWMAILHTPTTPEKDG